MSRYAAPGTVHIVYFSGTGCTKMAVENLESAFIRHGAAVTTTELRAGAAYDTHESADLLVLAYPVYAFSAPGPVYAYIKNLEDAGNKLAAVISVSGGGETTGNRASRVRAIRLLRKKSFIVVYESMLVMPSNTLTPTPSDVSFALIRALPGKVDKIAGDLMSGEIRRTRPGSFNRLLALLGNFEKVGARFIGRHIVVDDTCTGCGICADGCPSGNISLLDGVPVFGKKCVTCLKCFYGCPQKALSPGFAKSLVLKDGFDLAAIVKSAAESSGGAELPSGVLWGGLKPYIDDTD